MIRKSKNEVGKSLPTEQEFPTPSETSLPPLPKERVSFAPIGLLTIVFSVCTALFLFFSNFSDQHVYIPPVKPLINAEITLSANQFETFSNSNVCDGKGLLAGLPNAKLVVEGKNWSKTEKLGSGTLNTQSQCVYTPSFEAPSTYEGGNVKATIFFSSAKTQVFTFDLGPYPPYKKIKIALTLG